MLIVSTHFATFALLFKSKQFSQHPCLICTHAPPIARWCIGRALVNLIEYWTKRGAELTWVV